MTSNKNLNKAIQNKADEFYTTYEEVAKEVSHYKNEFKGKIVYCNFDDPYQSNFVRFFLDNFREYKLKRLVATCYRKSELGLTAVFNDVPDTWDNISDVFSYKNNHIKELTGEGSYDSDECLDILKKTDIVVTNPAFSLIKSVLVTLVQHEKKFLLIGPQNAIKYKEVFPLFMSNKLWLGYKAGDMAFRVPDDYPEKKVRFWIDENGQKWRSLGNVCWYTNLDTTKRHKKLDLVNEYSEDEYPFYETYDAIEVPKVALIPKNFSGKMGVPITFASKYNEEQFEILGVLNHGCDSEFDFAKPVLNGKELYTRILIRNKESSQL